MKAFKIIILVIIAALLIWIDFPENVPVHFQLGKLKVNTKLQPLSIHKNIVGLSINKDFVTKLGLDLQGGSQLVFNLDTSKVKPEDIQDAVNSAHDVIERRVNLYGVSEPLIQTLKSNNTYRISVDLPGISNVSEAVSLIGQTAQLSFKEATAGANLATSSATIFDLNKDTGLTGKDIKKATVVFSQQNGEPQVSLQFTPHGAELFGEVTQRNIGKQVGIFLDYFPISAPVVQQAITDGNAVISGNFTTEDANKLAIAINSGALPLPIHLIEQRNIGPTLGAMEVHKSIVAGTVGLLMVMLFMAAYYGRLGFIACGALLIYGLISFAIFRAIPIVLTLPGVAGFILSIGMAVDSNILIFERIKEERRKGRDFDVAIKLGFGRAIHAIKDANITTLIVAFILFNPLSWEQLPQFGLIKGFALTLAIGVATSLFTGLVITRRLITIFYKKPKHV
jgi:preprotein translocase subunit SecD